MTTTHRNALLATLSPEQLPVAEQLLARRHALGAGRRRRTEQERHRPGSSDHRRHHDRANRRRAVGQDEPRALEGPRGGRHWRRTRTRLRDLRAVVTSAKTVSLDDEARTQLKELQVSLTARLEHLRTQWNAKLETAVETKNVKEALALVARPPDMSTRVSADMAAKVVAITSEALNADADPTLWKEIVALTIDTSIRRNVKPLGIPE